MAKTFVMAAFKYWLRFYGSYINIVFCLTLDLVWSQDPETRYFVRSDGDEVTFDFDPESNDYIWRNAIDQIYSSTEDR